MGPVKRGDDPPESGVLGLKPVQGNGVREPEWTLQAVPEDRSAVWRLVFPPCAGRPRPVRDRAVVQVVVEDNVIGLNIGHGVVVATRVVHPCPSAWTRGGHRYPLGR